MYYTALTRVSSLPPRRRHDSRKCWFYVAEASRRPIKGPVTPTYCHVDAVFATYYPKSLKWLYVAHTRRLFTQRCDHGITWWVVTAYKLLTCVWCFVCNWWIKVFILFTQKTILTDHDIVNNNLHTKMNFTLGRRKKFPSFKHFPESLPE